MENEVSRQTPPTVILSLSKDLHNKIITDWIPAYGTLSVPSGNDKKIIIFRISDFGFLSPLYCHPDILSLERLAFRSRRTKDLIIELP
jgi:hypothetical protein